MAKTRKDVFSDEKYNLLVEDLSCRLPYGVMIAPSDGHFYAEELSAVSLDGVEGGVTQTKDGTATWLVYTMPYLRPMTSMTEDEKKELNELLKSVDSDDMALHSVCVTDFLNRKMMDYRGLIDRNMALNADKYEDIYKWLNKKNKLI